jgi:hypothetical protein
MKQSLDLTIRRTGSRVTGAADLVLVVQMDQTIHTLHILLGRLCMEILSFILGFVPPDRDNIVTTQIILSYKDNIDRTRSILYESDNIIPTLSNICQTGQY